MSHISKSFPILTFEVEGVYEILFTESKHHDGSVKDMLTRREDASSCQISREATRHWQVFMQRSCHNAATSKIRTFSLFCLDQKSIGFENFTNL